MQQQSNIDQLVMLRSGLDPSDADLLKSVLEGESIQAFVSDNGMRAAGYRSVVDVMVKSTDHAEASKLLEKIVTMPRCAIPIRRDDDGEEYACKHCGSVRVHPFEGEVPTFIPGIRIAAKKTDKWFHCLQCDSHYREERSRFSGMPIAFAWGGALGGFSIALYMVIDWLRWL
ncbi:putative signal transducing protein [Kordiimonas laminariae]|uniref:putative signal transducing protein n=1 Tax=Kordiimonas laminariae TaxID=2917717 RepID=UPI001FF5D77E|nr:DUF2007 domain-containing protein [Kordiimonas laminariae]